MAGWQVFPVERLVIVQPENPSAVEKQAALELSRGLFQISRKRVPLLRAKQHRPAGRIGLLLGERAAARVGFVRPVLPENTIEISRVSQDFFLFRGTESTGLLDAIYAWLDFLGCRWFHPEVSRFPERQKVALPEGFQYRPSFAYRDALWKIPGEDGDWASRNHLNGFFTGLKEKHGRYWVWEPFTHSLYRMVPPEIYGGKHPDYFAYRHGQGRLLAGAQLCLSHPDVFRIVRDYVMEKMAEPGIRVVAVAQMDCANYCQCPECEKKDRAGKSPAASLLDFVNRLAEETVRFHPDKYVATLAYQYSQTPPAGLKAHPNVIVKLCHMEPGCDFHSLAGCRHNRFYVECLQQWTRICSHVFVWHYVTNFLHNLSFHPNFDALAEDIRFYRENGVWGIFFQGQRETGVSLAELHAYCQARLAWDATKDYFQEVREFCQAYYGQAGEPIMELIEVLHQHVRQGFHGHLYTHPAEGTFTGQQLQRAALLLKEAEAAVRKERPLCERVELVRLWFNYTWLATLSGLTRSGRAFVVKAAPKALTIFYQSCHLMKKHQVTRVQEFPASHQDLREKVGWFLKRRKLPVYTISSGSLKAEVCPELAGLVCTLKRADGKINLLCQPAPWILRYPTMAGLTEGCTADGFGPGFMEPYHLVEKGTNFLVLKADLANQVEVTRAYTLRDTQGCLRRPAVYGSKSSQ
ncbi:MAG TPA: DUF4838 domain-containing protein, partial [bacterium]|nr:DUF4838 domain-containing protein [bacterium]